MSALIADNTLLKKLSMKNLIILLSLSIIGLLACKKEALPINSLIQGLDANIKLPNSDTTGAFAYIEGYIDGERFCLVDSKDSVKWKDYASALFGFEYQKEWLNGIGGAWYFQQPESGKGGDKRWYIRFALPTFGIAQDTSQFNAFKKKYATPNTYTNLKEDNLNDNLNIFRLEIWRSDIYDGKWTTRGLVSYENLDQTGSYIKLVSVKHYVYTTHGYHDEMTYEFDLKLSGNRHLTKGRMKTWVENIRYR